MKETRTIMGMPVTVDIVGGTSNDLENIFQYFVSIDERFSTYKVDSEISKINRGETQPDAYSPEMLEVLKLSEQTKQDTGGYFDIKTPDGLLDPSGLVKGWAINNAANMLRQQEYQHFWVEAGGDIQTSGKNSERVEWSVGIRNPFKPEEIVKVVYPRDEGIVTSGSYIRGRHIYDPHTNTPVSTDIVSLTVIGPNVYEADRYATAAYAMSTQGILFIEQLPNFEGYAIDQHGMATMTSGFETYLHIQS
ncbi:MAG: thiamine biosynthesis protein [Candidatus Kaiserbacteria bacterium]|nr:thiamine biosynthesis protein [Candidatus Kaiserbacteria bacterium]